MTRLLSISILWVAFSVAQQPTQDPVCGQGITCFTYKTGDVTVASAASTALTVQQPAANARQVTLAYATAQCATNSGASTTQQSFDLTQAENGTAASATAIPATSAITNPVYAPIAVTGYTASNASGGVSTSDAYSYQAGSIASINLSQIKMASNIGTKANYTITVTNTGSGSCTARILISGYEASQ